MKKIYTLLLCAACLTGCKKADSANTEKIVLSFNVNQSATFYISYFDENDNLQSLNFTGTSWSKTFTTTPARLNEYRDFIISDANPPRGTDLTGSSNISINGKNYGGLAIDFSALGSDNVDNHYFLYQQL